MKKTLFIFFAVIPFSAFGAESCPDGYIELDVPSQVEIVDAISCPAGYVEIGTYYNCSDNQNSAICTVLKSLCNAGFQNIKLSSGVSFNLYQNKSTSPALYVKYNNIVCYGNLATGSATNSINIKLGDTVYHLTN